MRKDTAVSDKESQHELEKLRAIILGENNQQITDTVNKQARKIVSDVLTEALHDRQKKDGSVNKVLLPIVENSVEHSVTHHSDRLISTLYPLMGSLVRKSVGAFLTSFIEKTNQLIENSFTIKGLKWRFKAWQAGVTFTQYVVSQTYNYRVEHVLLIHQKTGLLLKAVNLDQQTQNDTDLISSMLTAINDFIGDSFQIGQDGVKEQLKTVSTDNFNLLIKPGPSAIIVAAVTGNSPQQVSEQLQVTLEEIHHLYIDELTQFNGDNSSFDNLESQLNDCLLIEEKAPEKVSTKKPIFAWVFIAIFIAFIGFKTIHWYKLEKLHQQIMAIDQQAGIIVKNLKVTSKESISLDVMRDPDAVAIRTWFTNEKIPFEHVRLIERKYYSLSSDILKQRANKFLVAFPNISLQWQHEQLLLAGNIDGLEYQRITDKLKEIGIQSHSINTEKLIITNSHSLAQSIVINQQIFKGLVGKISTIQLSFGIASDQVTPAMKNDLQQLKQQFLHLLKLANQLNISVGLLVMGSSDNSGNIKKNNTLSLKRAENTAVTLMQLGLSREQIFVTGLGQIDIKHVKNTARKVMFNVIYIDNKPNKSF